MHVLLGILGLVCLVVVLGDAFETVILPRRVARRFRLTRLFFTYTWAPWRACSYRVANRKHRESLLGFFGPLSLILLLVLWALLLILAFALLHWGLGSGMVDLEGHRVSFAIVLYASGTTFTTLGLGDIHPVSTAARFLMVWEAGTGFGFLAIVIGYLPIIYQSFSRREGIISLLDARAGSPGAATEMLRRYAEAGSFDDLHGFLRQWEQWAAELLESHISYPVLAFYRSQHSNESWIGALTIVLDTCALLIVGVEGIEARQAQLTFAMARHAAVDLSQVMGTPPVPPRPDRLPAGEVKRLRARLASCGVSLSTGPEADDKLRTLRRMYEPYVNSLASYFVLDLPPWFAPDGVPDNWQTSAWERAAERIAARQPVLPDEHW